MDIISTLNIITDEYKLEKSKALLELQAYADSKEMKYSEDGVDAEEWDPIGRVRKLVERVAAADVHIQTVTALIPQPTQKEVSEPKPKLQPWPETGHPIPEVPKT